MDHEKHQAPLPKPSMKDYLPLATVVLFVVGSALIFASRTHFTVEEVLMALMGFFFLYFSLFKLISLPDFAMGYQEYDLIAKRIKAWAWMYPFIEVILGAIFLLGNANPWVLAFTVTLTAINSAGIFIKLAKRELFHCVCLGTVLKVPLTIVSLVEYLAMGLMALAMLLI
jgi:hypothetical protein